MARLDAFHVKRERLIARIPEPRAYKCGISGDDILRIPASPEFVAELLDCLRSDDELDLIFALMFAERLGARLDFCAVAEPSLPSLAAAIRSALAHSSSRVRTNAIRAFVVYRACFDDYPIIIRSFLGGADPQARREALAAAPTFLKASELALLLPFREDSEVSETGGMGGPLRYPTRDLALSIAERIAGRQFSAGDCSERLDGSTVSWRCWSAFTKWLDSRRRWSFLGL